MMIIRAFLSTCLILLAVSAAAEPGASNLGASNLGASNLGASNLVEKGRALLGKTDYAAAIAVFKEAARQEPTRAEALEGWGDALAGAGDRAGAIEKYNAALALKPETRRLMMQIRNLGIGP